MLLFFSPVVRATPIPPIKVNRGVPRSNEAINTPIASVGKLNDKANRGAMIMSGTDVITQ